MMHVEKKKVELEAILFLIWTDVIFFELRLH